MITNQLHDLHATGASLTAEARIIAEADDRRILTDAADKPFFGTRGSLLHYTT